MVTSYRVFKRHDFDGDADPQTAYAIVGDFPAHNTKAAIKAAVDKLGDDADGCTFAACPVRGWAEANVSVETVRKATLA